MVRVTTFATKQGDEGVADASCEMAEDWVPRKSGSSRCTERSIRRKSPDIHTSWYREYTPYTSNAGAGLDGSGGDVVVDAIEKFNSIVMH